jgi:hypothetical protein
MVFFYCSFQKGVEKVGAKRYINKAEKISKKEEFMTEQEMVEINDKIDRLNQAKGDMSALYSEWSDIEEYYKNEQAEEKNRPNSKINIMNANIEGQIAMCIDQNIETVTRGEGAGDQDYADQARIALNWTIRKNRFKKVLEQHERRRFKFGTGIFHAHFDPDAINGFGLVKICTIPLTKFYLDGKIKDPLRYQEAEWMAEIVRVGKCYIQEMYGEEKASAVDYGNIIIEDLSVFEEDTTQDDLESAVIIKWWERHKGKLRLIEFSGCGLLLYDSHKKGYRDENQKNAAYDHKPYYKHTCNKYPYFITPLYPDESRFWGFGDGHLILPLQKMINELYDKIRICARPNIMLYDINSDIDLEDYADNSLEPRPYDSQGGKGQPVFTAQWGQINSAWWQLLASIHSEVQRVTRFSGLMMGQDTAAQSATEAAIQQQQGNTSTNHKKNILQETLSEMFEYVLGIMIEAYTEGKTMRVSDEKDEYEYVDFRSMANVPVKIPATRSYIKDYKKKNPDADPEDYKWELLTDGGKPMTKNIDLDIDVSLGAGMPRNPSFLYQMAEKLSQMQIVDASGQPKPVVSWEEMREILNKYISLPLKDNDEAEESIQQQTMESQQVLANNTLAMGNMPQNQRGQEPMQNPDASGLSPRGRPMMTPLNQAKGGGSGGMMA